MQSDNIIIRDAEGLYKMQEKIIKNGTAAGNALLFGDKNGVNYKRYIGYADALGIESVIVR